MKRKLSKKEQNALDRKLFIENNRKYDRNLYGFVKYNIRESKLNCQNVSKILMVLDAMGVNIDTFGVDDKTKSLVATAKRQNYSIKHLIKKHPSLGLQ